MTRANTINTDQPTPTIAMFLDNYLHQFDGCGRVTLVGPVLGRGLQAGDVGEPVVWVDGGVNHRWGDVGFSVGDGDSSEFPLDHYLSADKDCSDLAYVLGRVAGVRGVDEVVLLGFLGARRDHELFNLGEVHHFLAAAATPTRARFDDCVVGYSKGRWRFQARALFSLAAFAPTTVTLTGACDYPLPEPTPIAPLVSLGLSNRGFGEVTLTTEGPVFILKPAYNTASPR